MVKFRYIIQAITKSYSHKPHLQDLPHDLRSTNPEELQERIDAIDERVEKEKEFLQEKYDANIKLNDEIRKLGDINKELEEKNKKLKTENKRYEKFGKELFNHFEKVSRNSQKDANEISNDYENLKKNTDADFSEIDSEINNFVNNISKEGYLPWNYEDEKTKPLQSVIYINDRFNPMIENIKSINTPEANQLATKLEKYKDNYNPRGNNNNTKELEKIENKESDTWYISQGANNTKIRSNNKTIEQNNKEINEKLNEIKSNAKDIKYSESRLEDYKDQRAKTEQRKEEVE